MDLLHTGATIYLYQPGIPKPHLWVVLTEPEGRPRTVVAVMLVTAKQHSDTTVCLKSGEHPFVTDETSVNYSTARHLKVAKIQAALGDRKKTCELRQDVSQSLVKKIRKGLLLSPRTEPAIRDYCAERF